jgi:sugar/nucleoside kinase (ribokinase family)
MKDLRDNQAADNEGISQAIRELGVASKAAETLDRRATIASCRRAAGLAWKPQKQPDLDADAASLMAVVKALAVDPGLPSRVRQAARRLSEADRKTSLVAIQRRAGAQILELVDAAKTIVAEAWYRNK